MAFSVASFIYRLPVILVILILLGQSSLVLGIIFAVSTAFAWLVMPSMKIVNFLLNNPRIRRVRKRALLTSAGVVAGVVVLLALVPVPFRTMAEGVVWVPEEGVAARTASSKKWWPSLAPGSNRAMC